MNCPKCEAQLSHDSRFCHKCGCPLQSKCLHCSTVLFQDCNFCPVCGKSVDNSDTIPENKQTPLGYCSGDGSAIFAGEQHFKCLQCENIFTDKFRFLDHPVCESCAYKDGTAQQLEKELSAQREAEARAKEEQLRRERAEQERRQKEKAERKAREAAEAAQKSHICPVTGMEFVVVPEGEFQMGDVWGDGNDNEKPTRLVTVPAFQMAKYPVTQAQWLKVMGGENPAESSGDKFVHPDKPVINVSWDDAQEFIKRLNRKSGCSYRLPREAEWEYAARSGGSRDKYSGTSNESSLSAYAHFDQDIFKGSTNIVGQKRPNDLELYDMSGNVWEWCEDCWHDNYQGAPTDGSAWTSGGDCSQRVQRGGSWLNSSSYCRVAYRLGGGRGVRGDGLGFRLSQDSR